MALGDDARCAQHYFYRRWQGQDMEVVARFQVEEAGQGEFVTTKDEQAILETQQEVSKNILHLPLYQADIPCV
jgi:hypothetical protein